MNTIKKHIRVKKLILSILLIIIISCQRKTSNKDIFLPNVENERFEVSYSKNTITIDEITSVGRLRKSVPHILHKTKDGFKFLMKGVNKEVLVMSTKQPSDSIYFDITRVRIKQENDSLYSTSLYAIVGERQNFLIRFMYDRNYRITQIRRAYYLFDYKREMDRK